VNGNCAAEATSQPEKWSDYDPRPAFPRCVPFGGPRRTALAKPDSGELPAEAVFALPGDIQGAERTARGKSAV
jgi:hypothetical protein